uniref:Serpin domain-containing protein n=1 Tax=Labrus bergylta TaxID=56723 RepID=A0A3Q3MGI8_9LABR
MIFDDFQVDKTTKVKVDMMTRIGDYKAYWDQENHTTVVMLPYKGKASMMIILPDEDKMKEVEGYITKDYIRHLKDSLHMSYIDLSLPKFSISADADLENTLKEMGITNAFENNADFSGISEECKLKISKVGDSFFTILCSSYQFHRDDIPSVTINRPFLVFIVENTTGSILFMGKINDPTAK